MPNSNKKGIYTVLSSAIFLILFSIEWSSTCTFFIRNYYLYSLFFMLLFVIPLLFIYRKIEKFGWGVFLIVIMIMPIFSFYTLPRMVNFFDITNSKEIVLEGTVKDKYYLKKADSPYVEIFPDDLSIGIIITTVSPLKFDKIIINRKIKIKGKISFIGFCFYGIEEDASSVSMN